MARTVVVVGGRRSGRTLHLDRMRRAAAPGRRTRVWDLDAAARAASAHDLEQAVQAEVEAWVARHRRHGGRVYVNGYTTPTGYRVVAEYVPPDRSA